MVGFLYMYDLNAPLTPIHAASPLTYVIVVRCGAAQQSQALSAFHFTKELLLQGHRVVRVFFYQQGVQWASGLKVTPQGEVNLTSLWQQLGEAHGLELGVCIAAALQGGIVDQQEASRYELTSHNLAPHFSLIGLGQLASASADCDRLVSFGG